MFLATRAAMPGFDLADVVRIDVEDRFADRRKERAQEFAAVFRADLCGKPQKTQPGGVAVLILRRKVRVVVHVLVDDAQ